MYYEDELNMGEFNFMVIIKSLMQSSDIRYEQESMYTYFFPAHYHNFPGVQTQIYFFFVKMLDVIREKEASFKIVHGDPILCTKEFTSFV